MDRISNFLAGLLTGSLLAVGAARWFYMRKKKRPILVRVPTFGLTSPPDLFAKLQRDADLLDKQVTSDCVFNFVVTGYSLIDWIKNDSRLPSSARNATATNTLYRDLRICGDLANGCKHFVLGRNKRKAVTSAATTETGYGVGRFGKGGYGIGEESIVIRLNDGSTIDCLAFVRDVLSVWEKFFSAHGI
jgi:hypothetical protein